MMFARAYSAPRLAVDGQLDDDDMMQKLLRVLMQRGDQREQNNEEQTQRRMAALVGVPRAAKIEDHVRRQQKKDLNNAAQPARVVEAHIRGEVPRPDQKVLDAAGVTAEELERRREEIKQRNWDRLRKQKEAKYERGTHGSRSFNGVESGGEKMTPEERRRLAQRIDELRGLLQMERY